MHTTTKLTTNKTKSRQEQQVIKQNEIAKKPSPQSPSHKSFKCMLNNKGTVNHLPLSAIAGKYAMNFE